MKKELIKFYLSWVNDYLTVKKMAEDYGIEEQECFFLINVGRKYHEQKAPEQVELTTVQEIKKAVDEGKTVYMENEAYQVIKDKIGQYMIKCTLNGYCIGLHGAVGSQYEDKLNGTNFYYKN